MSTDIGLHCNCAFFDIVNLGGTRIKAAALVAGRRRYVYTLFWQSVKPHFGNFRDRAGGRYIGENANMNTCTREIKTESAD